MTQKGIEGFTLVELLLSLGIMTVFIGATIPFYGKFQSRSNLDVNAETIVDNIRQAQLYSRDGNQASSWGIAIQSNTLTLFKGATYAARDSSFDENTTIPPSLTLTGLNEIDFTPLNGIPSTTGAIVLTSASNETRTLTVNSKGSVDY